MEQYNDSADAPDLRTRRYRGTIASPSAVSSGDYLYRSNHEYWNGSSLIVGGSFAFDNTNNANRTQFAVSVNTDGTSADPNNASKTQFKIDGNDSGAITFNNAYKFPTSDGSANQVLQTDGSGTLSFASVSAGGISGITVQEEGSSLTTAATTLNFVGSNVTATGDGVTKTITITGNDLTAVDSNIVPDTDRTYDLGTITNAFKDLFLNDNVKQKVNVFTSSGGLVTPVTNFTFKLSNRQIFENVFTAAGGLVTSAINNTVFDDNNPAYRF
jgi:hypothetical protein